MKRSDGEDALPPPCGAGSAEVSKDREGLNVRFVCNSIRKLPDYRDFSLLINKDRRYLGVKSEILILGEPPYPGCKRRDALWWTKCTGGLLVRQPRTQLPTVFFNLFLIISINIGEKDKPIIPKITVSKLFFTKSRLPKK